MRLQQLKRKFGALDMNTLKNGLSTAKKIFKFTRDIDELAKQNNIEPLKKITNRLINNKVFDNLEKGVDIGGKVIDIYGHTKGLKINNISGNKQYNDKLNKIGEDYAREQHYKSKNVLKPISKRKSRAPLEETEDDMALKIVNSVK